MYLLSVYFTENVQLQSLCGHFYMMCLALDINHIQSGGDAFSSNCILYYYFNNRLPKNAQDWISECAPLFLFNETVMSSLKNYYSIYVNKPQFIHGLFFSPTLFPNMLIQTSHCFIHNIGDVNEICNITIKRPFVCEFEPSTLIGCLCP